MNRHVMLTESQSIACDFFDSGLRLHDYKQLYEGAMDSTAIKDLLVNAIQAAVDAGVDIAAMGIPADTVVDVIMAVYESGEIINSITAPVSALTVAGKDISAALKGITLKDGADAVLDRVRSVIRTLIQGLKTAGIDMKTALAELSKKLQDLVSKTAEATGDWIASFIPDVPGIDLVIANAIKLLSDNSYDVVAKTFDSMPDELKVFFYDPKKLESFLNDILSKLISFFKDKTEPVDLDKEVKDEKERSLLKRAAGAGLAAAANIVTGGAATGAGFAIKNATGAFNKVMGPKLAEFLEKEIRPKIPAAVKMMQTIVPLTFAVVATYQVIVTEYSTARSEGIRRDSVIIREYIRLANEHTPSLSRIRHEVSSVRSVRNSRRPKGRLS